MTVIVVSDTSPIANLILIEKLDLLRQVFLKVIIPPTVNSEIEALREFNVNISLYQASDWIKIKVPSNPEQFNNLAMYPWLSALYPLPRSSTYSATPEPASVQYR